jgi:predicted dehydrogenase
MRLPEGFFDRPRQELLIARDRWAIIRIETGSRFPANESYTITARTFNQDIMPYLHGNWVKFDRLFGLRRERVTHVKGREHKSDVVYSFAEHLRDSFAEPPGDSSNSPTKIQKLPNITVVPNLETTNAHGLNSAWTVFGCTMGHYHPPSSRGDYVQEVYEFQSSGVLMLDRGTGEVEMWVAQDGDKVAVPTNCHMTLYNLGDKDHPLITLNFAHPEHDPNKEVVRACGPILLAYYNDFEVVFSLNWLYINNPNYRIGVRLADPPREEEKRKVRITRGARLDLGRLLYEQLTQNPDLIGQFARLGIRVRPASSEAVLEPLANGTRLYFSRPLVEATKKGTEVYRYFYPETKKDEPGPSLRLGEPTHSFEEAWTGEDPTMVETPPFERHLLIVIEGGGDWVEQTYRRLFKKKIDEGKRLSVFYADDTRWKPRPQWADANKWNDPTQWLDSTRTGLQPWEVYLDKADPDDYAKYLNLRPDVVFIVTPDFTHSAIARQWIGKSPLVFIEKPFDSQIKNVEDLLLTLGQRHNLEGNTEILGLDHYQFYALPIIEMKPRIDEHLGREIKDVVFYLTEDRPIEKGRVHSLQYGLTLDLLPHLIALLTYFGEVSTIDEISIVDVGQYHPLVAGPCESSEQESIMDQFHSETCSCVQFTFQDDSGNGYHIPCRAVVGKGFSKEVKYLQITGSTGNAIRLDLNRKPSPNPHPNYPWDSLFFLQGEQPPVFPNIAVREEADPYCPSQRLRIVYDPEKPLEFCQPLERSRYEKLLNELLTRPAKAVRSTLTRTQGRQIVLALDRIWWAIQESKPWKRYFLGRQDPFKRIDEF